MNSGRRIASVPSVSPAPADASTRRTAATWVRSVVAAPSEGDSPHIAVTRCSLLSGRLGLSSRSASSSLARGPPNGNGNDCRRRSPGVAPGCRSGATQGSAWVGVFLAHATQRSCPNAHRARCARQLGRAPPVISGGWRATIRYSQSVTRTSVTLGWPSPRRGPRGPRATRHGLRRRAVVPRRGSDRSRWMERSANASALGNLWVTACTEEPTPLDTVSQELGDDGLLAPPDRELGAGRR